MQNLEIKDTIQKIKKTKSEVKRELEESITNGGRNENANMQQKVNECITSENAVKAIQEFEKIIENKKSDIVWLAYYEGQIFKKIKEKEFFVSMVLKLNVSKSTIIDDFLKIKYSSLSLHFKKN